MTFRIWLQTQISTKTNDLLDEDTINSYVTAIEGPISDIAKKENISSNLLDINNQESINTIISKLKTTSRFQEENHKGHNRLSAALGWYYKYASTKLPPLITDIEDIKLISTITKTQKDQLISARLGQGKYRHELIELWNGCSVTKIKNTSLLIASHIKTWAQATNKERLDKYNGLLLTPNLDTAFDKKLISFDENGNILISKNFKEAKDLGILQKMSIKLKPKNHPYMKHHREEFYKLQEI